SFQLAATIEYHFGQALVECKSGACVRDLSMDLVEQLKGNFYVENCVTSLDTQADCLEFMELAKSIMWERKFDLGGWEFNTNYEVPPSNVLGLLWDRKTNTFKINVRNLSSIKLGTVTRRIILSAEILYGTIWDQEVDPEISARFMTWMEEIRLLSGVKIVKISRWLPGCTESKVNWTLHIFSDAYLTSYGSAAFLRVTCREGV
ncbi:hypothetical protein ILUMI_26900, partial [Ignelater luminosus]